MMLAIEGLTAGYGRAQVLHGVDLTVAAGEVVALMGRNGMGKTTLLRRCMGRLPARGGSIRFGGADVTASSTCRIVRAGMGYVPQGREIFDDFSVADNLRLSLLGCGRVDLPQALFRWFPLLAERRDQRAGTLSGGEQQMLAIARALVPEPKLLLLDEPSEGIQPSLVHAIGEQQAAIVRATGLSLLLVEQNVDLVTMLAHRVAFMARGRIVETCPVADLAAADGPLARHLSL
jgi:ABC-type branched-subunit amino acid transport system ATPase component